MYEANLCIAVAYIFMPIQFITLSTSARNVSHFHLSNGTLYTEMGNVEENGKGKEEKEEKCGKDEKVKE